MGKITIKIPICQVELAFSPDELLKKISRRLKNQRELLAEQNELGGCCKTVCSCNTLAFYFQARLSAKKYVIIRKKSPFFSNLYFSSNHFFEQYKKVQ